MSKCSDLASYKRLIVFMLLTDMYLGILYTKTPKRTLYERNNATKQAYKLCATGFLTQFALHMRNKTEILTFALPRVITDKRCSFSIKQQDINHAFSGLKTKLVKQSFIEIERDSTRCSNVYWIGCRSRK